MSFFSKVGAFLAKVFKFVETDLDKIAIAITEGIKQASTDGVLDFIASILDGLTKSNVPAEIVALIKANIDKVLAVELAIQGLPADPTAADILAFEQAVLKAIGETSDKSKLHTTIAAQIYTLIQAQLGKGTPLTFAQIVAIVEQAYQDYVADQAADTTGE